MKAENQVEAGAPTLPGDLLIDLDEPLLRPRTIEDTFADEDRDAHESRFVGDLPPAESILDLKARDENDPSILLAQAWLCRKRANLVVGPTGVGKSTLITQASLRWCRGEEDPVTGTKPGRPLRTLVVQAENDEGDLADMRDGILGEFPLTPEDEETVRRNLVIVTHNGATGREFCDFLRQLLERERGSGTAIDLVVIDPLLSFFGANPNDAREVSAWLRQGLHPLIEETNVGVILVAHTPKPPRAKADREIKMAVSDYANAALGSSEWANYARGVLAIGTTDEPRQFCLIAGKRGSRLGWTDGLGNRVYEKRIRQSEHGICWHACTPEEEEERRKAPLRDVVSLLPQEDEPMACKDFESRAKSELEISRQTFFGRRKDASKEGLIDTPDRGKTWFRVTDKSAMRARRALDCLPAGGATFNQWKDEAARKHLLIFKVPGTFNETVQTLETTGQVRRGRYGKFEAVGGT